MSTQSIVDLDAILEDLRLAVKYAARVGLLKDRGILATLAAAEDAMASNLRPDIYQLTVALNDIAAAISPVTLADLHFERDPFLAENQKKSRFMQIGLTFFCLVVLLFIGYFMNALQREQEALVTLEKIQDLRPQQKLTELRKMAQWEAPLAFPQTPHTLYDQYHQKVAELMQINSRAVSSYTTAVLASQIPLFPLGEYFSSSSNVITLGPPPGDAAPVQVAPAASAADNSGQNKSSEPSSASLEKHYEQRLCGEETGGELMLPEESSTYPKWMKTALRDSLNDFCFQLKVISPGGSGALLSQSLNQLEFVNLIKEKVSLRSTWFLPFLYGLLGSAIFMMRNVSSVRTPSMEWFPIVMRISLGGVAGIVMGWFSVSKPGGIENTSLISLPFALAFLTGYGIDVLFTLLDRLNRAMSDSSPKS